MVCFDILDNMAYMTSTPQHTINQINTSGVGREKILGGGGGGGGRAGLRLLAIICNIYLVFTIKNCHINTSELMFPKLV